ncbi:unnamed protein product [Diplocarpon coronariae]|uniref:Uncharacterized protein n=1 Tax=Diplocarpon coronariae TaxID=2795749 RepID=A0A218YYE2_9HELO|nr:hypothetical protein B2J93_1584 [Marssonina coronariae]
MAPQTRAGAKAMRRQTRSMTKALFGGTQKPLPQHPPPSKKRRAAPTSSAPRRKRVGSGAVITASAAVLEAVPSPANDLVDVAPPIEPVQDEGPVPEVSPRESPTRSPPHLSGSIIANPFPPPAPAVLPHPAPAAAITIPEITITPHPSTSALSQE